MKLLYKISLFSMLTSLLWSCEKDENRIYLEGGTAPVLTASSTTPALSFVNSNKEAVRFDWNNPDFQFTTGTSSHNVNYILEFDVAGQDFNGSSKHSVAFSNELSKTFSVGEINDIMLNSLKLTHSQPHDVDIRLKASIGTTTASLFSNSLKLTATPYEIPPKVDTPSTSELYIVGSATEGGWNNPVPTPSQQFTRISATLYEITVKLVGGGAYLLIPRNGQWAKYNVKDDQVPGIKSGGDFNKELAKDIPGPDAAGMYKITVDFQRGKFTVVKQ